MKSRAFLISNVGILMTAGLLFLWRSGATCSTLYAKHVGLSGQFQRATSSIS